MKKVLQQQTGKLLYQTPAATFRRAEMSNLDLAAADLPGEDLSAASLDGATLSRANLAGARLAGARLKGAVLKDADLSGAHLAGADFYGASLRGARLARADLSNARLDGADLRGADLEGAILERATFGNRLPDRSDVRLAWVHIQRILSATPDFLVRRLLPITLPIITVMAAYILLRINAIDFQYDRTRLPASWPRFIGPVLGYSVDIAGLVAIGYLLRGLAARLGTRKAAEGYLGLLFFFVSSVYLIATMSGYISDVAAETPANTAFRVVRAFGFAILVSVVLAVYGVPARLRRVPETRVDPGALWRALGVLTAYSSLGFVLMNARMILAPFMGEFASPYDVEAFWRYAQLYVAFLVALLAVWGIMPRLPVPATLGRANLRGVDLGGANLRGINMSMSDLNGANLAGADVRHADLRDSQLAGADLGGTIYDGTTRWPEGFDPAAAGAQRVATSFWHVPITSLLLRRRDF